MLRDFLVAGIVATTADSVVIHDAARLDAQSGAGWGLRASLDGRSHLMHESAD